MYFSSIFAMIMSDITKNLFNFAQHTGIAPAQEKD